MRLSGELPSVLKFKTFASVKNSFRGAARVRSKAAALTPGKFLRVLFTCGQFTEGEDFYRGSAHSGAAKFLNNVVYYSKVVS